MIWWSPKQQFNVTLRLCGLHPYVAGRRDYEDRDVVVRVEARSWDGAERQGIRQVASTGWWTARVIAISKASQGIEVPEVQP